ncbi:MAG: nucleoside-diphosphate kinase [Verrucomicrobiota bacterium]|nr:nucleoside-diphosphate kinase [Limisphaera sp.]MDW8382200.1 nucleoside-diphosphate kinase [Verrucomicrobiota bacterium]
MSLELAYALITPHSLLKSRTGGILSRLIARTGLDFVAARMFAPSAALAEAYAAQLPSPDDPQEPAIQQLFQDYVRRHLSPEPATGRRKRVMMLVFQGENAVRKLREVVGFFAPHRYAGQTIRDTYGDLVMDDSGRVRYFEPAVLIPVSQEQAKNHLKLWARFSDSDGGLLTDVIEYPPGETPERTLVLLKPDNFRFPTGRPGNVIDFFSRTGLFIIAIKVHRMSVAQAVEFYGPVREVLRTKLKGVVGARARAALEKELGFALPASTEAALGDLLGPLYGENQFENIVRFMSGRAPSECAPELWDQPGTEKCIALVYEGANAVAKIRDVLGPTDPSKAPPGSIRREFGSNVMVNAAHASDSPENAQREMRIVKPEENQFRQLVEHAYGPIS